MPTITYETTTRQMTGSVLGRWLHRRRTDRQDARKAHGIAARFLAAAAGLGLAEDTQSCAGTPGLRSPQLYHVSLGADDVRIFVKMLPGQLLADYEEHSAALAEAMGGVSLTWKQRAHGYIVGTLRTRDPLAGQVPLPTLVPAARVDRVLIGLLDSGRSLTVRLDQIAHMIVQGATRSGKSRFIYGLLSQLAQCSDVRISGSDVTGLLLRPFVGTRHGDDLALGTRNITEHAVVLERLVSRMDERIARIPDDVDVLPVDEHDPYELVVLEELPGLIRAAEAVDALHKGDRKYVPLVGRIRSAYGRLMAEGAKVGFRVVIVMQRADASIIGGFERGQATFRITFPVLEPSSVQMLHPSCDTETAALHATEKAGIALVSGPGVPLARMRSPQMGDYGTFRANVSGPGLRIVDSEAA